MIVPPAVRPILWASVRGFNAHADDEHAITPSGLAGSQCPHLADALTPLRLVYGVDTAYAYMTPLQHLHLGNCPKPPRTRPPKWGSVLQSAGAGHHLGGHHHRQRRRTERPEAHGGGAGPRACVSTLIMGAAHQRCDRTCTAAGGGLRGPLVAVSFQLSRRARQLLLQFCPSPSKMYARLVACRSQEEGVGEKGGLRASACLLAPTCINTDSACGLPPPATLLTLGVPASAAWAPPL